MKIKKYDIKEILKTAKREKTKIVSFRVKQSEYLGIKNISKKYELTTSEFLQAIFSLINKNQKN